MAEGHQKFVGEEPQVAIADGGDVARRLWLWVMGLWFVSRGAMMTVFALTPRGRVPMSLMMLVTPAPSLHRYAEVANAWLLGGTHTAGSRILIPLVILPRLISSDFADYKLWFSIQMLAVDLGILLLFSVWKKRLGAAHGNGAAAVYLLLTTFIAPFVLLQLDGVLALFVLMLITAIFRFGVNTHLHKEAPWILRIIVAAGLVVAIVRGPAHSEALLWVAGPLALLGAWPQRASWTRFLSFVAFGLTGLLAQCLAVELANVEALPFALRVLRDLSLSAIVAIELSPMGWHNAAATKLGRIERNRERWQRLVPTIALLLVFVWMFLASLSRVVENDIWWLMRVGKDVLTQHIIPSTDVYSATASGQAFQAHEWLTGIVFYQLFRLTNGQGLSVLQMLLGLGCAGFLVGAISRQGRRSVGFLPCLVATLYVVAFRIDLRPHVLSLLGFSYLAFALERWRRDGTRVWIATLVPLQIVWVNLHGGAWLVPVLLAAVAVGTAIETRRKPSGLDLRSLHRQDALTIGAIAIGTALSSLCNPYGWQAATFAFRMGSGQGFMMRTLSEWQPTLSIVNTHDYPFWFFMTLVIGLWLSLAMQGRKNAIPDLLLALAATMLGLRCVRFTAELAVLTFPLLVRSLDAVLRAWRLEPTKLRRPTLEAAMVGLLITGTASYGYAFNAIQHRGIGTGYAGDLPYAQVNLMKSLGLHGVVFNDYDSGGLISYALHPQVSPVIDSRIEVFGPALFEEHERAFENLSAFEAYAHRYNVDFVLLAISPTSATILAPLLRTPEKWKLLSDSGGFALLQRVDSQARHEDAHASVSHH